ncbi:MAG TPA: methylenetetrahydrofolate reductase [NAD(P)H] [Polyangiales bacterium]
MNHDQRRYSLEFFPPKTDAGRSRLYKTVQQLAVVKPDFVSVTFGAGGSTREGSYQVAAEIVRSTDLDVTPHLSCIGWSVAELREMLVCYRQASIESVVALRGDAPENEPVTQRAFEHANELVEFVRAFGGFRISVACYPEFHPEAASPSTDVENFVRKVNAGADEAITQYFYNNDAYYSFVDRVRRHGVNVPIVPGLMPLTDYAQVARFSRFCGAEIPQWIRKRMEELDGDTRGQHELGIELAARQAEDLLRNGAPGLHLYTLNRAEPTLRVFEHLGLAKATSRVELAADASLS